MLRFVTLRWRTPIIGAISAVVAIAWYASVTASAEMRLLDFARLAQAQSTGGIIGAVALWWLRVCAVPWRPDLTVALAQAACIAVAAMLIVRRTGSVAVAVATAAVLLAFALPAHWLGRPLGVGPAFAVLGTVIVFAGCAEGSLRARREMLISSFIAALSAGWPVVPIATLMLLRRDRMTAELAAAAALGVAARVLLGVRVLDAAGVWSASEPHAFLGLRLIFWFLVLTPALLFVITRPVVAQWLARFAGANALAPLVPAAVVLGVAGTFLAEGSAAVYAACAVLVLVVALIAGNRDSALVRSGALAFAVVVLCAGAVNRAQHPVPDDAAWVADERRSVHDAAAVNGSVTVVDRGDASAVRRFPPFVLSYLAGGPVRVRYAAQPSPTMTGGVVEATAHGLVRIDPDLRAFDALDAARRRLRYDLYAHRLDGAINSRHPEQTPSGAGVIPSFVLTGPDRQVPTITVLSGYSWTFDKVLIRPKSSLVFVVTKPLPLGRDARGTVTVTFSGRRPIIVETDLPPADPSGPAVWRFRSVPLDPPRPTVARIVFATSSPSGTALGDWASFGMPSIVGSP